MTIFKTYSHIYIDTISILHRKAFMSPSQKLLFLDRDGVLIDDVHYIRSPKQVIMRENVTSFLKKAREFNYDICIVTNQSSVGRSLITINDYLDITEEMLSKLSIDLHPDFILANFNLPNSKNKTANWRKPGIGMFSFMIHNFSYSPIDCKMIGDKLSDLIPAHNSGVRNLYFIDTVEKKSEKQKVKNWFKSIEDNVNLKISNRLDISFL